MSGPLVWTRPVRPGQRGTVECEPMEAHLAGGEAPPRRARDLPRPVHARVVPVSRRGTRPARRDGAQRGRPGRATLPEVRNRGAALRSARRGDARDRVHDLRRVLVVARVKRKPYGSPRNIWPGPVERLVDAINEAGPGNVQELAARVGWSIRYTRLVVSACELDWFVRVVHAGRRGRPGEGSVWDLA